MSQFHTCVGVRHRTYGYTEICYFLKLLRVSVCVVSGVCDWYTIMVEETSKVVLLVVVIVVKLPIYGCDVVVETLKCVFGIAVAEPLSHSVPNILAKSQFG